MREQKQNEMILLCRHVRELLSKDAYPESKEIIRQAMSLYPDAPEPHNLMGIWCEKQGLRETAMRHFRAAVDLEPSYTPARQNLMQYADFNLHKHMARYNFGDGPEDGKAMEGDKNLGL